MILQSPPPLLYSRPMKFKSVLLLALASCGQPFGGYSCEPTAGQYCVCDMLTRTPGPKNLAVQGSESGCSYMMTYNANTHDVCTDSERIYEVANTGGVTAVFEFASCDGQRGVVQIPVGESARFYGAPYVSTIDGEVSVD